jgi:hypothetical protein
MRSTSIRCLLAFASFALFACSGEHYVGDVSAAQSSKLEAQTGDQDGGPACASGSCDVDGALDAGEAPTGGAKKEGELCATHSECGSGLLCCYPCGTAGCQNACTAPVDGGACPNLF